MSGRTARGLAALACVLGIASAIVPASAGAADQAIAPGLSLVLAGGKARSVAGNVAVPVRCIGSGDAFCTGQVTLSRAGHHISSTPFSVRAGDKDLLFLPLDASSNHPRRIHGTVTTIQPIGPAITSREFLYAR